MQTLIRGADRVLVEVNDTFLGKLGFAREQVIGKTAFELNFWVDPEELAGFAQEVESKGFVLGREVRLRAHDGRVLTVLLSTQPVETFPEAVRTVGFYRRRWVIEELSLVMKSGLGAEKLQMDDRHTLQNTLALLYVAQAQYDKAEPLYVRAVATGEQTLGPDHADMVVLLDNYAALLRQTQRDTRAFTIQARAKAIRARYDEQSSPQ